jgi:hypothetical protein
MSQENDHLELEIKITLILIEPKHRSAPKRNQALQDNMYSVMP